MTMREWAKQVQAARDAEAREELQHPDPMKEFRKDPSLANNEIKKPFDIGESLRAMDRAFEDFYRAGGGYKISADQYQQWEDATPDRSIGKIVIPTVQKTYLVKVECPECGYLARVTEKWLKQGRPTCPCGTRMQAQWD